MVLEGHYYRHKYSGRLYLVEKYIDGMITAKPIDEGVTIWYVEDQKFVLDTVYYNP